MAWDAGLLLLIENDENGFFRLGRLSTSKNRLRFLSL